MVTLPDNITNYIIMDALGDIVEDADTLEGAAQFAESFAENTDALPLYIIERRLHLVVGREITVTEVE